MPLNIPSITSLTAAGAIAIHPQEMDRYAQPSVIQDLFDRIQRRMPLPFDFGVLSAVVDALTHPNSVNDRKLLLEYVLVFISRLPDGYIRTTLENTLVTGLYKDLVHPPATYLGPHFAWRTVDGSFNNPSDPNMGKAGMPYARSVQQAHALPLDTLPDPGLLFDTLLKRNKFVKHPAGVSSLMFSFAAFITHMLFRTDHTTMINNETSSYIDLTPLYGHTQDLVDKIRLRDGTGCLHPDCFAEDRLLFLPPAVSALLVLFNRNHNYIASRLLDINEGGTFRDPRSFTPQDPDLLKQDEHIFQVARLNNSTWCASIVFSDYLGAILGMVRDGNNWSLNPFREIRGIDHSFFERGRGNTCSVEFNSVYRWHATASEKDEMWIEDFFKSTFSGKSPDEIKIEDYLQALKELNRKIPNPTESTFDGLQRQSNGRFKDADLARILQNAISNPAGAFKARGTPHAMRFIEILGIEQNRRWGVCSLNDLRRFLGLKPFASFLEWNSNTDIANTAERLYGSIESLELYVGLQAEESKPVVPGAGLCPSYTISRAILSDAIALTRGDRFFTTDFTPFNMTAWGFADCQREPRGPGYGSTLGRLFLRTLPDHFSHNSVYTWFPFMTPDAMGPILTKWGDIHKYDFGIPKERKGIPRITSYEDASKVLGHSKLFATFAHRDREPLVEGQGFFISSNDPARAESEQLAIQDALIGVPGSEDQIAKYFFDKTWSLMANESSHIVGSTIKTVDLGRNVLKFVPIYWACEVAGIPLKKPGEHIWGAYTPQEVYDQLTDIYSYLFLDVEPSKLMWLQEQAKSHTQKLLGHIKAKFGDSFSLFGTWNVLANILRSRTTPDRLKTRFHAIGFDSNTLANAILALVVGCTVELSQALVHLVNFFLNRGSPKVDLKDEVQIEGLILEALRLDPTFNGVYRKAITTQTIGDLPVKAGDTVFVDIASANLDADAFPNPNAVDPKRSPKEGYLLGEGCFRTLGREMTVKIMCNVLKAIFLPNNVRRAPGKCGVLKRYKMDIMRTSKYLYLDENQHLAPWVTSFDIQYE